MIFGWIFLLLVWVIGVLWYEVMVVGLFIGQKLIINEFVVYMNFGEYLKVDVEVVVVGLQVILDYIKVIIFFVLCGFVNLLLIVILIGGFGGMVFNWWQDIVQFGLCVVVVGMLFNLMSVIIVGVFFVL